MFRNVNKNIIKVGRCIRRLDLIILFLFLFNFWNEKKFKPNDQTFRMDIPRMLYRKNIWNFRMNKKQRPNWVVSSKNTEEKNEEYNRTKEEQVNIGNGSCSIFAFLEIMCQVFEIKIILLRFLIQHFFYFEFLRPTTQFEYIATLFSKNLCCSCSVMILSDIPITTHQCV